MHKVAVICCLLSVPSVLCKPSGVGSTSCLESAASKAPHLKFLKLFKSTAQNQWEAHMSHKSRLCIQAMIQIMNAI